MRALPLLLAALVLSSCRGQQAGALRELRYPPISAPAPDLELPGANDRGPVSLRGARGRVVLVVFLAAWSDASRSALAHVVELDAKYGARGLVTLGVSEDDSPNDVIELCSTYSVPFPIGFDFERRLAQRYDPHVVPSFYVVDRGGVLRQVHRGFRDGDEVLIEQQLRNLLFAEHP